MPRYHTPTTCTRYTLNLLPCYYKKINSYVAQVHSCSVDPQKNHRNYLITHAILKFQHHVDPRYSAVLLIIYIYIYIYISAVGSKNKKLAVLP